VLFLTPRSASAESMLNALAARRSPVVDVLDGGAVALDVEGYCATIFSFASSALPARRLRAMIWRLISLVPSPISLILTCRQ
jgi:hypothetical protein